MKPSSTNKIQSLLIFDRRIQLVANGATIHEANNIRTRIKFIKKRCIDCLREECPCDYYTTTLIDINNFIIKHKND